MKRPKLRKASKRLTCSKRYKIQKKVREHDKKIRKEAKKKGISKKIKKDPGVPRSAPFKEDILREAKSRKLQLEELKEKNKVAKQQVRAEKRKREKEAGKGGNAPEAKKAKKQEVKVKPRKKVATGNDKNSKKFRCCELNKVIDASDVVVEVLDARDPQGCRCPQLEEAVLKHDGKKKLIFVLNKIDLVPKENVEKWIQHLQAEFPTFAFKASTQLQDRTVQQKKNRTANCAVDHTRGGASFGGSCLLQLLGDYSSARGSESMLKVGVVGFPNVGKSSLINSLKGVRACHAGVQRGMTKNMQDVHISKNVKMLDSPGIVAAPSNPAVAMALRSLQVEENEESPLEAVRMLLKQCEQQQIMLQYNVPDYRNSLEFLTYFAKKRGFLQKGGVPSTELAATTFLNDWTGAKLSYHCKPTVRHSLPSYLSDAMVTEMQKGLDMDKLRKANEETIKSVKFPNRASSIGFSSVGPTAGLVKESEIPEEIPAAVEVEDGETEETSEEKELVVVDDISEDETETQRSEAPQHEKMSSVGEPAKVNVLPVPVNIDVSSAQHDDAYDFNTDFV